jgi:pimeloyl-ACP methyl ester carboxylesterase
VTAARPGALFYLHGFASSARSTKARYLAGRLRERGRELHCPDFNEPDFSTLTLTRMLDRLDKEMVMAGGAATLIGSSLGGALAVLAAAAFGARVERLVLLAPAVEFAREGHHLLPPDQIARWRRDGRMAFFHYGEGAERTLNVAFYEDSLRYNPFDARFSQPTIIFQGMRDVTVDPAQVEAFARTRPNVTLTLLDDDHQLAGSLPRIWDDMSAFLEIR